MEIKDSSWRGSDYKLLLNRKDRKTLRSLYDEEMWLGTPTDEYVLSAKLARKLGRIANNQNVRVMRVTTGELQQLADVLTDYANRTPQVVEAIAEETGISPWLSEEGIQRLRLCKRAAGLALQIGVEIGTEVAEVEIDKQMKEIYNDYQAGPE